MAPSKKDHADRRLGDVLECATKTLALLRDKAEIPGPLVSLLESHAKQTLPLHNTSLVAEKAATFDSLGTDLWNFSAQLVHDDFRLDPKAVVVARARIGVLIRVFALLLLDTAHRSSARRSKDQDQQVRILNIALRTSRLCSSKGELELSLKALEICSQNLPATSTLEQAPLIRIADAGGADETTDEANAKTLTGEYHLMRLMHAWKSKRLDLADHFHVKFDALKIVNNTELSIKEGDLYDEIAKSLVKSNQQQDAIKWSERAFRALEKCDDDATTQEAAELKLCVGECLVDQLLADKESSSCDRARKVVDRLEKTHGLQNRVAVEMIKFQVMAAGDHVNADQVYQILLRMVNMTLLTDDSFKITMRTMGQAARISASPTLATLKAFICNRLLPELQTDPTENSTVQTWVEKATVAYIMFATSPSQGSSTNIDVPAMKELLDEISRVKDVQFSPKATHAAQTLLWKVSADLGTWTACQLLQHPLFSNAGHLNKARVGRKMMRHALDNGDLPVAREAFFQMPKDAREESLSQFLAFRLALKSQDEDLAAECLRNVARHAAKDPTHLYACVVEAQQSPMRHMAVMALQAVLGQRPPGIQLACLLRCTVRLLIAELDAAANDQRLNEVTLEVLQLFETAAQSVDTFRQASSENWRTEIQWWSKNAFNLSIRLCGNIDPEYTVRFLTSCSTLMKHYPNDGGIMQQDDIENRKMLCAFLTTTALIVLGRSEDRMPEYTLQCYLSAQQQISIFDAQYARLKSKVQGELAVIAAQRAFAMLKFSLECLLKLNQFDKLGPVLQSCLDASPPGGRWDTLADLLIIIHKQLDTTSSEQGSSATAKENIALLTTLLQKVINDTWKSDKDITKVARWLRYTFMLCINHTQSDFSLKLLQQAASMAENGHRGKHEEYPEAELQWLATTGFNHAIDLLAEENDDGARQWMDGALEVARWSQDDGGLHGVLTGKRNILQERLKERGI